MKLYIMEPEVAGGLGKNTIYENLEAVKTRKERPKVKYLHYEFDGWLGDDILETTPCFIITENLANDILKNELKGYCIANVEISKSMQFNDNYPHKILPKFKRLIPKGRIVIEDKKYKNWTGEDFCQSQNDLLVISQKALDFLNNFNLRHAQIVELEEPGHRGPADPRGTLVK